MIAPWVIIAAALVSVPATLYHFVLTPVMKYMYPGISPLFVFQGLPLLRKEKLTDTEEPIYRLVFGLPEGQTLDADLSVGEFVRVQTAWNEKPRLYSPTRIDTPGELELVVKRYENGKVSKLLCDAAPGDMVQMSGPYPPPWIPFVRTGPADRIGLIAFGVGITEAWPLAQLELAKEDGADVHLLWANRSPADVFDLDEMQALANGSEGRLKISLIYSRASVEGSRRGRIDTEVLKEVYGDWLQLEHHDRTRFLVAGTKQMKREGYRMLKEVGFPYELVGRRPFGKLLAWLHRVSSQGKKTVGRSSL